MNSTIEDRLARLAALRATHKRDTSATRIRAKLAAACRENIGEADDLAQLLGAVVGRNRCGKHLKLSQWFSTPEPRTPSVEALRLLVPRHTQLPAGTWERMANPEQWLFLDTETTGLAGGTGTYAFLVGLAWWEAGGLQAEQFFMRDHGEEHSLLLELAQRMAERRVLVTFNGKTFDWPLLETRYTMTRAIAPRSPAAHLDMLRPARQLWRLRLGSVRLKEIEQHVLGPNRLGWHRADDIDSALIPQIYFDYLRGGPPEPLVSVFRHNQMDLRGLAALAGRILALLSGNEPSDADGSERVECVSEDSLELYGLSRLLRRRGKDARARLLYERALAAGLPAAADRAARRELALLAKRERDYARATSLWEDLLRNISQNSDGENCGVMLSPGRAGGNPAKHPSGEILRPGETGTQNKSQARDGAEQSRRNLAENLTAPLEATLEACEQLAIYYEHRAREPQRAAQLTRDAVAELRKVLRLGPIEPGRYRKLHARLEHRLARLTRKSRLSLLDI